MNRINIKLNSEPSIVSGSVTSATMFEVRSFLFDARLCTVQNVLRASWHYIIWNIVRIIANSVQQLFNIFWRPVVIHRFF